MNAAADAYEKAVRASQSNYWDALGCLLTLMLTVAAYVLIAAAHP